jgi:hypothetical protein
MIKPYDCESCGQMSAITEHREFGHLDTCGKFQEVEKQFGIPSYDKKEISDVLLQVWKKYKDIPAYQHILFLMNERNILSVTKNDFDQMDEWDAEDDWIFDIEKQWKLENKDSISEFPEEYAQVLKLWISKLAKYLDSFYTSYEANRQKGLSFRHREILSMLWEQPDVIQKKINKYKFSLYLLENKDEVSKNQITPEMIVKARMYPIEQIIQVDNRKFAKCPFHSEKSASFFVKNNFGYCFGCSKNCDSIELFMKINNKGFAETVKLLQ